MIFLRTSEKILLSNDEEWIVNYGVVCGDGGGDGDVLLWHSPQVDQKQLLNP